MHPALSLKLLENLPKRVQASALAVCSSNGPLVADSDVKTVLDYAKRNHGEESCLPFLYGLLDPSKIPSRLDAEHMERFAAVDILRVTSTLQTLNLTSFLFRDAAPEIWSRVLPWVVFLFDYGSTLAIPTQDPRHPHRIALDFLTFSTRLFSYLDVFRDRDALRVLACGWKVSQSFDAFLVSELGHHFTVVLEGVICPGEDAMDSTLLLETLCDGIDGGPQHLAKVILDHLRGASKDIHERAGDKKPIESFLGIVELVMHVDLGLNVLHTRRPRATGLFLALLRYDFVGVLSKTLAVLVKQKAGATAIGEGLQIRIIGQLILVFGLPPGNLRLPEALENHLLESLVQLATTPSDRADGVLHGEITILFKTVFPDLLFRYSCVRAFQRVLVSTKDKLVGIESRFKSPQLVESWTALSQLLTKRIALLEAFQIKQPFLKVCSNLKCTAVLVKRAFKRCSGCMTFLYCSKSCQIEDWCRGGHRDACSSHYEMYLRDRNLDLTGRDRSFLRKIADVNSPVDFTYGQTAKPVVGSDSTIVIVAQRVYNEHKVIPFHPGTEREAQYLDASLSRVPIVRKAYDDLVRRASESNGHLSVDLIQYYPGRNRFSDDGQMLVMPVYSSRPRFQRFRSAGNSKEQDFREEDELLLEFHY
ncbi:MYND-type domain-containing protein [Mycena kentingensis (nom. inval.)]|nr:MYND-type domain-containing protein [Mycena kentingensis (nom. inval.)]